MFTLPLKPIYSSPYRCTSHVHQFSTRPGHTSAYNYQGSLTKISSMLHTNRRVIINLNRRKNSASDNSEKETSPPAKPPSTSWKNWVVGIVLSIILPSFRHKWGPLQVLKSKVDMTIETVESVTEVVEELAEQVEKVADEVGNKLPEDAKLKEAVESVEILAKEAVKESKQAEQLIHKVEEVEKEVESKLMISDTDQAEDSSKEP